MIFHQNAIFFYKGGSNMEQPPPFPALNLKVLMSCNIFACHKFTPSLCKIAYGQCRFIDYVKTCLKHDSRTTTAPLTAYYFL